jgi:hypothetical protein
VGDRDSSPLRYDWLFLLFFFHRDPSGTEQIDT